MRITGTRMLAVLAAVLMLLGACTSTDGGDATDAPTTSVDDTGQAASPLEAVPPSPLGGDPAEECPPDYSSTAPVEGRNEGFLSADQSRSFEMLLPTDGSDGPRPFFLALTGTVQPEADFLVQSQLDQLTDDGWIVVAPVRNDNGVLWPPWDAMRTPASADDPNPDLDFMVELVRCIGAHQDVDANRIYVGGISIGGTMVNYVLQRESELFAGGIVGSGNYALTAPSRPEPLDDMVVIVAWGGDNDVWSGCSDGATGDDAVSGTDGDCVAGVSFVADASRASQFYAREPDVQQVACTMDLGHIWLTPATEYMAAALLAHPKGLPGNYELPSQPPPPEGLTCTTDPYLAEGVTLDD